MYSYRYANTYQPRKTLKLFFTFANNTIYYFKAIVACIYSSMTVLFLHDFIATWF